MTRDTLLRWAENVPPYPVEIGRWLTLGWHVLAADLFGWILLTIVYGAVQIVASSTGIGVLLILGPLEVGLYAVVLSRLRKGTLEIGELGRGFSRFIPGFLAGCFVGVLATVGLAFLIFPGLVVLALYLFTFALISDFDIDFWTALEVSRKVVARRWVDWTLFVLVQTMMLLIGTAFCGVGLLLAFPWIKISTAVAYEEIFAPVLAQQGVG